MALPSTYRYASRGFSLIEILVVVGLVVILSGLALFVSMDSFRGSNFRTERDLIVSILQHARALSINNVCDGAGCVNGLPHGLHVANDSYVLFQGSTYNSADINNVAFERNNLFSLSGFLTTNDVLFLQLEGTTTCSTCDLTISDGAGHSSTISVSAEGRIAWTN
jgi:prepilin-type N-terminal cleavage/methylation domain-containing protein